MRTPEWFLCAALLTPSSALAAPQGLPLAPAQFFPCGHPTAIQSGDLDGDGDLDVVAIGGASSLTIAVLLGNGAGALGAATSFSFNGFPVRVALGDLNGDGNLDIVTTRTSISGTTNGLAWRLGNGSGGFGSLKEQVIANFPAGIAIADVSHDGKPDVVVGAGMPTSHELITFVGDGAGNFPTLLPIQIAHTFDDVSVDDLNFDGAPDACAVSAESSTFEVALGIPASPFFSAPVATALAGPGVAVVLADLNGDPAVDALVAMKSPATCLSFLGNGAGGFGAPAPSPLGSDVLSLAHGDLNGDGLADLVETAGAANNAIAFCLALPGGGFAAPVTLPVCGFMTDAKFADLNADGHADVIVACLATGQIAVLKSTVATPLLVIPYGVGTPGCSGVATMSANGPSTVGNAAFGLTCTSAPPRALGLGLVGSAASIAGSDPLALGVTLHVDLFASALLVGLNVTTDASGTGFAPLPIPNVPGLVGLGVFAQALFVEDAPAGLWCSASFFRLMTTRGLAIAFLP